MNRLIETVLLTTHNIYFDRETHIQLHILQRSVPRNAIDNRVQPLC